MENRIVKPMIQKRSCTFILLCLATLLTSCMHRSESSSSNTPQQIATATYNLPLILAEKTDRTTGIKKELTIKAAIEDEVAKYLVEDEQVIIYWRAGAIDISFRVDNTGSDPVKIIWDETKFIDAQGKYHRMIHSGIGYRERNLPQPLTVILPKTDLEDFLHPADYFLKEPQLSTSRDSEDGYRERSPFLPAKIKGSAAELKAQADSVKGKTFKVMLPLETKNGRVDYWCTFRIDGAKITEREQRINQPDNNQSQSEPPRKSKRHTTHMEIR